jgi:hypothetical protein
MPVTDSLKKNPDSPIRISVTAIFMLSERLYSDTSRSGCQSLPSVSTGTYFQARRHRLYPDQIDAEPNANVVILYNLIVVERGASDREGDQPV